MLIVDHSYFECVASLFQTNNLAFTRLVLQKVNLVFFIFADFFFMGIKLYLVKEREKEREREREREGIHKRSSQLYPKQ